MARPKGDRAATERRKQLMIEEAFLAFSANGYSGTSLRSIATAVGVSEAALIHHFGSKAGLMWAVLEHRDKKSQELIDQALEETGSLAIAWIQIIRNNQSNAGLVSLFSKLLTEATNPDHPVHAFFLRRYFIVQDTVVQLFEQLRDRGQLIPGASPRELAPILIYLSDGVQLAWLMNPSIDMVRVHLSFFKDCMTPEGYAAVFGSALSAAS